MGRIEINELEATFRLFIGSVTSDNRQLIIISESDTAIKRSKKGRNVFLIGAERRRFKFCYDFWHDASICVPLDVSLFNRVPRAKRVRRSR